MSAKKLLCKTFPYHCLLIFLNSSQQYHYLYYVHILQVASACVEASVICTNLLHPKVPSLHSTISLAEIKPKAKEVVHVMSNIPMTMPQIASQEMELVAEEEKRQSLPEDSRQGIRDVSDKSPGVIGSDRDQEEVGSNQQTRKSYIGGSDGTAGENNDSDDEVEDDSEDEDINQDNQEKSDKTEDETETDRSSEDVTPKPTTDKESTSKQTRGETSITQSKDGSGDAKKVSGEAAGGKGKRKRDQEEGHEESQSSAGKRKVRSYLVHL